MRKIEKSITIDASVEKVFDYVGQPTNLPEIWPSLVEMKDVEPLPTGGKSYRWVYKMAGVLLEGTGEHTEYVANRRIVAKNSGSFESTVIWIFQPEAGGTKVTVEAEYTVPIPVLGKVAEALIVKLNEREAELILANLKARMEA
ncbi:unnamed protein product [marine sediment metagenome]|uniref:Coenzyme Q-binding protein COQ10 START domain-containing protein n=1 Tax=marine sediment metagenome TaxID=412755 RepID=X1NH07_9ZZZZ